MAIFAGCGGGGAKAPVPFILNINSSTDASSPLSLPIEINGSGFQSSPGTVIFTEGSTVADATVAPGGWSDTGIVVPVPGTLTAPGTATVTVKTSGGTSNGVTLTLVLTPNFSVNNVTWTTEGATVGSADLPVALTGLRAVAVPVGTPTSPGAFIVVAGGFDGIANRANVYTNTLAADGTVGGSWIAITDMALPITLAHFAMAEADPGNSLLLDGSRLVYVIGGQQNSTDAPGGVSTVYMGSMNATTGAISSWTTTTALPQALVGPSAAVFNGYIYVVGGLHTDGSPSTAVYTALVNPDGTLGSWATSSNPYPLGISFAPAFGFGGKLYVLGGDTGSSTAPNSQTGTPTNVVYYASASKGVVGTWATTSSLFKNREKQVAWIGFGQIIAAEGVYAGSAGSSELEHSTVNADSTLASWTGITSTANQIGANVYNASAVVDPLPPVSSTSSPKFLLLGGQAFVSTPPGALSNKVYYNTGP